MESEFYLDIELSLFAAAFIMHNSLLLSHYEYVAAGNHKHGFLCEVQGFLCEWTNQVAPFVTSMI